MVDSDHNPKRSHRFIDLSGKIFGRLLVVEVHGIDRHNKILWRCRCDCGTEVIVLRASLRSGNTQSCGCLQKERTGSLRFKHGQTRGSMTREYITYLNARQRCNNPKNGHYHYYGGRGIKFLFSSFEEFFNELGPKPSRGHSIDRIDVNGHYKPGNVRWATAIEQADNKRPRKKG